MRTIENLLPDEYFASFKAQGNMLDHMPPSLPDIRVASVMNWQDIYNDPKFQTEEWWNAAKTENVVVDGNGAWKYRVDFYHPYTVKQREAAIEAVLDSKETDGKKIDRDALRKWFQSFASADPVVRSRVVNDMPKNVGFSDTSVAGSGGEYEYSTEQINVPAVPPEKSEEAIAKYIQYCQARGIDISYTPFPKK
jgi:hypothetical protein